MLFSNKVVCSVPDTQKLYWKYVFLIDYKPLFYDSDASYAAYKKYTFCYPEIYLMTAYIHCNTDVKSVKVYFSDVTISKFWGHL
jgi:hypothetical protein